MHKKSVKGNTALLGYRSQALLQKIGSNGNPSKEMPEKNLIVLTDLKLRAMNGLIFCIALSLLNHETSKRCCSVVSFQDVITLGFTR